MPANVLPGMQRGGRRRTRAADAARQQVSTGIVRMDNINGAGEPPSRQKATDVNGKSGRLGASQRAGPHRRTSNDCSHPHLLKRLQQQQDLMLTATHFGAGIDV